MEEEGDEKRKGEVLPLIHRKQAKGMGHDEQVVSREFRGQARVATAFVANAPLVTQAATRVGYSIANVPLTNQTGVESPSSFRLLTTQTTPQGNPTTSLHRMTSKWK